MRLVYADRSLPGIRSAAHGDGLRYLSPRGRPLVGAHALKRVSELVIPPAWTDVWISPNAATHIQATGVDAKGRLQYVYHPLFRQTQEAAKFSKLIRFAQRRARSRPRQLRLRRPDRMARVLADQPREQGHATYR